MSSCSDILRSGVFNKYSFRDQSQFRERIRRIFEYEYDSLKESRDDGSIGVELFGIADAFLGREKEDYSKLREKIRTSQDDEFDALLSVEIESRIASKEIVDAWKECMIFGNPSDIGIQSKLSSGTYNNFDEFLIQLSYIPNEASDPDEITLKNVTLVGIEAVGTEFLSSERRLPKFSSITQKVVRTSNAEISASIDIDGRGEAVTWSENALIETKWHRKDETGRPYTKVFSHNTGQGCPRTFKSGIYRLGLADARIYRVDFLHEGQNKGWNYHTRNGAPREYEGDTSIIEEGRGFIWRRIWEGGDVTEYYTAYYELWRQ